MDKHEEILGKYVEYIDSPNAFSTIPIEVVTKENALKAMQEACREQPLREALERVKQNLSGWEDTDTMMGIALKTINAALAGDGWIRVEDGLPPKNDKYYYWLYSESIDNYEIGEYDYEYKYFVDKIGDRLRYVSHWKIPTPPQTK